MRFFRHLSHLHPLQFLAVLAISQMAKAESSCTKPLAEPSRRFLVRFSKLGFEIGTRTLRADPKIKVVKEISSLNLAVVELGASYQPKKLGGLANVMGYEPEIAFSLQTTPNDPQFPSQWNFGELGVNAEPAWRIQTGSSQVRVAVLDSGIDYDHPDLAANIWQNPGETGRDFLGQDKRFNQIDDDNNGYVDDWRGWDFAEGDNDASGNTSCTKAGGHGSHTSGIIAAVSNNALGVAGTAWGASLVPLKITDDNTGTISLSVAIEAIVYAANAGISVSNNSWGNPTFSPALEAAIAYAGSKGHLLVAAAGNNKMNTDTIPFFPASTRLPNVISVAAIQEDGTFAESFSSFGPDSVDLAAPGANVLSTSLDGQYRTKSGTSMATPHVTGAVALLLAQFGRLSPATLKEKILRATRPEPTLAGRVKTAGALDLGLLFR